VSKTSRYFILIENQEELWQEQAVKAKSHLLHIRKMDEMDGNFVAASLHAACQSRDKSYQRLIRALRILGVPRGSISCVNWTRGSDAELRAEFLRS